MVSYATDTEERAGFDGVLNLTVNVPAGGLPNHGVLINLKPDIPLVEF